MENEIILWVNNVLGGLDGVLSVPDGGLSPLPTCDGDIKNCHIRPKEMLF